VISIGKDGKSSPFVVNTSIPYACFNCSDSNEKIITDPVFILNNKKLLLNNHVGHFNNHSMVVWRMEELGLYKERVNYMSCSSSGQKIRRSSKLIPSMIETL